MDKTGEVDVQTDQSDGIESERIEDVDLYSDVLSLVSNPQQSSESDAKEAPPKNSAHCGNSIKKIGNECRFETGDDEYSETASRKTKKQVFIGNLTWWTTDEDIKQALIGIGVTDFDEIKFYDNRINGQSKGYCAVTCGSDECLRMVNRHLSKVIINGQSPTVSNTKSAFDKFEALPSTRQAPSGACGDVIMNKCPPNMMPPRAPMPSNFSGLRQMGPYDNGSGPRLAGHIRHPFEQFRGMPPAFSNGPMLGPQRQLCPPGIRPGNPAMFGGLRMQMMNGGPPGRMGIGPLPPHPNAIGSLRHDNPRERQPMFNNFSSNTDARFPFHPPELHHQGHMPPIPRQILSSPTPHLNPAFMHNVQNPPTLPHTNSPEFPDLVRRSPPMQEEDVEEIMARNRMVSSAALNRAIADATEGEYVDAIDVLITAINLIQQSKIGHDPRCQVLIGSLQDILSGIRTNSKKDRSKRREGPRKVRRSRSRSRERSRAKSRDRIRERFYSPASDSSSRRGEREFREKRRSDRDYEEPIREHRRESDRELERGRSRHDREKLESLGRRIPEFSSEFNF